MYDLCILYTLVIQIIFDCYPFYLFFLFLNLIAYVFSNKLYILTCVVDPDSFFPDKEPDPYKKLNPDPALDQDPDPDPGSGSGS